MNLYDAYQRGWMDRGEPDLANARDGYVAWRKENPAADLHVGCHQRLTERVERHRKGREEMRQQFAEQEARDAYVLAELARMGVTFGDPVPPHVSGCNSCVWHVEGPKGSDGGPITAIASWVKEGYLGEPEHLVLHPVIRHNNNA